MAIDGVVQRAEALPRKNIWGLGISGFYSEFGHIFMHFWAFTTQFLWLGL